MLYGTFVDTSHTPLTAFAAWLLEVLRPHIPHEFPGGLTLADVNERCRFLCYTPGQYFAPHCDGCYARPRGHPRAGDCSLVTVRARP